MDDFISPMSWKLNLIDNLLFNYILMVEQSVEISRVCKGISV